MHIHQGFVRTESLLFDSHMIQEFNPQSVKGCSFQTISSGRGSIRSTTYNQSLATYFSWFTSPMWQSQVRGLPQHAAFPDIYIPKIHEPCFLVAPSWFHCLATIATARCPVLSLHGSWLLSGPGIALGDAGVAAEKGRGVCGRWLNPRNPFDHSAKIQGSDHLSDHLAKQEFIICGVNPTNRTRFALDVFSFGVSVWPATARRVKESGIPKMVGSCWFRMETPIKIDDLGVPCQETSEYLHHPGIGIFPGANRDANQSCVRLGRVHGRVSSVAETLGPVGWVRCWHSVVSWWYRSDYIIYLIGWWISPSVCCKDDLPAGKTWVHAISAVHWVDFGTKSGRRTLSMTMLANW